MTPRAAALAVAVLAAAAAACRTPGPIPVRPEIASPRPRAVLDELARDVEARRGVRGVAKVEVEGPEGSGSSKQVVIAERPDRLRLEFLGFLNQTVALFATDGERFQLLDTRERRFQRGPVYPGLLWEAVQVDLTPEEAVAVLLGDPGRMAGLEVASADRLPGPALRIDLEDESGTLRRRLEFDAAARLRRAEVAGPRGGVDYEVRFDDYREAGGEAGPPFAHRIALRFPATGVQLDLSFGDVELNPQVPPELFHVVPPQGFTPVAPAAGSARRPL